MGFFTPDKYVTDVSAIDLDELWDKGKRALFLDRDNTVVPRDTKVVPPSAVAWLDHAHELGYRVCLVSNNFHSSQVGATARLMGCEVVDHAMKPAPFALRRAMRMHAVMPGEAVMIGDQVFTDVAAGNLARVRTVLVRPQSRSDLWYTHVFRVFERLALRGVTFEGE